jgi:hypothetical protein
MCLCVERQHHKIIRNHIRPDRSILGLSVFIICFVGRSYQSVCLSVSLSAWFVSITTQLVCIKCGTALYTKGCWWNLILAHMDPSKFALWHEGEQGRLSVFLNRMLRKISGPKKDGWGWRKLHNEELLNLYSSPNTITMTMSRRMVWTGHGGGEGGMHIGFWLGKSEGKRQPGRPRHRWENNIKMKLSPLEKPQVFQNSPTYMEPGGPLACSNKPATSPCPEPD